MGNPTALSGAVMKGGVAVSVCSLGLCVCVCCGRWGERALQSPQAIELGKQCLWRPETKASQQQRMLSNPSSHTYTGVIHDLSASQQSMLRGNGEKTTVHLTKQMLSAPILTSFTSCHHSLKCRVFTDWKEIVRKKGRSLCVLGM